jgi:hypothetical protein
MNVCMFEKCGPILLYVLQIYQKPIFHALALRLDTYPKGIGYI